MFEQELYNEIAQNFINGLPDVWQNTGVYFGEAPENQKAPYIVMYPLNNNGTRQVLCDVDDYTDGATSIQFNIYDTDYSNAMYLGRQLDIFLAEIRILSSYRIMLNNNEVIRGFPTVNTGLSLETVTRYFTYTIYGDYPLATSQGLLTVNINDNITAKV